MSRFRYACSTLLDFLFVCSILVIIAMSAGILVNNLIP